MKLPEIAIRNYQFTLMIFLLLIVMGSYSFLTMPRMEDPPLQLPGASIIIVYPGASPSDIEELVVSPVEESLNELDDIKKIETTIQYGLTHIAIEFNFGSNASDKYDEVVQQVNSIKNDLPGDIHDLEILRWRSSDVCIMQMALVSETASFRRLEKFAEDLMDEMEKIEGVLRVEAMAYPQQQIRVAMDMEKMAQMNISVHDIEQAVKSNNANIPGGNVRVSAMEYNIRTSGSYDDLEEIRNTVIKSYNGRLIYLRHVAEVDFDYEDHRYLARFNGRRAIFLTVQQKEGYNIYDISGRVKEIIEKFRDDGSQDIELFMVFDQSRSVDKRISSFFNNLLGGIFLVGVVIVLSLGFRASILVMLAIPFSILIGLGFVDLAGYGLQQISITALVIALGLLVDNSIVIIENTERFISMGKNNREAAILGAGQLGWPITAATTTTVLAFIPIITMPDKAGKFIESLPVTVIFTLTASLLIAIALNPLLARVFLKKHKNYNEKQRSRKLKSLMKRFIQGPYRQALDLSLRKPAFILTGSLVMAAGAVLLFTVVGVSFFPKAEKPQFMVRIQAPEGSGIDHVDRISKKVESILDTVTGVEHYAANIGHGNPRIYYNIFPKRYEKNFAEIYVELKTYDTEEFDRLVHELRLAFHRLPGARIELKEFEQGAPIEAPLAIKVTGNDMPTLRKLAADVEHFVMEAKGTVNINNPLSQESYDLVVKINRDKASLLGVPVVEIDRTVRAALAGSVISQFRNRQGEEFDIVMRLPIRENGRISDFGKIYIQSLNGRMIPLEQLALIEFKKASGKITHYNLDRNATITADIIRGYNLNEIAEKIDRQLRAYSWPRGFDYEFTGEVESRQESFEGMGRASIIAMIAIFAVLVLQFRSFTQPLIIFTAIPLAAIGSVIALYITGNTFSFTAFIGLISLIGIVVNNSIILVDYSNELIHEGRPVIEAVKEAGEVRFTPIILTTFTTIGGLLPLTLRGGTMWAPMGWTIIGGLLLSTLLTLIVVPVLYKLITSRII